MRRLSRDTRERGRTVDQVLAQYHESVRPMHQQWVEPSKKEADLIVHSTGHSMDTAITVLSNHLKVVMARESIIDHGENGVAVQDDSAAKL
jgi:uridine kinase